MVWHYGRREPLMKISVGIPNIISGTDGITLVKWAKWAEKCGYASVSVIDRIAYDNYESMVTLSAVATVTKKINLIANIIIGPARNPILLAKQAASLDQLSNGRFVMGVGVGSRKDDFIVTKERFSNRGKRWDESLSLLHQVWKGDKISGVLTRLSPAPVHNLSIPLLIAGYSNNAIERVTKWGIGWTASGLQLAKLADFVERVRKAWYSSERNGDPYILGSVYFALGPHSKDIADRFFANYYGYMKYALDEQTHVEASTIEREIKAVIRQHESMGLNELIFVPMDSNIDQLQRLNDVVL